MSLNYFEAIPSLVVIETNLDDFKWSYGLCMPKVYRHDFDAAKIKISLSIEKGNLFNKIEDGRVMGKFHYFSGEKGGDVIYYDRNFLFNRRFQYKLEGLKSNHIKMTVNHAYFKYVTHRFMNVHSVGYILTDVVNLKLLQNGLCPIHCSAVEHPEKGSVVIFAPPNTGKTLTSMKLCMDDNYNYMAEDLALTDGNTVYSVPWTSTFRYYSDIDTSLKTRILSKLTEKISFVELLGIGNIESIEKYIDKSKFSFESKVNDLVILERDENVGLDELGDEYFFSHIHTLDRYEFNYMRAPAIIAYSYFNPEVNIQLAQDSEIKILKKMIQNANKKMIVKSSSALDYAGMIRDQL